MALSTLESEGAKGAPHAAGGDALGVPDGAVSCSIASKPLGASYLC